MSITQARRRTRMTKPLLPLENGDCLDQKTFHARYQAMPAHVRAELIGGVVYIPSPQKKPHSRHQQKMLRWLDEYEEHTPGTEALVNPTAVLGPAGEPAPDGCLLIVPECGGQTAENAEQFMVGGPELLAEIAWSTESIDLNSKKRDYETAGVREYLVIALRTNKVFWFIRRRGKFTEMAPDTDGIYRSRVFPGLWLDASAMLPLDVKRVLAVLHEGLASTEHANFVARLAARGAGS